MKIVVIGSTGQLGSDLVPLLPGSVTVLSHKDFDITDTPQKLDTYTPDMVINLSAYHRVDDIETNGEKAFAVNAFAVQKLAEYCKSRNSILVQLSSDYVFGRDTTRKTPYTETDTTAPLSVYGHSRVLGEYFVQKHLQNYFLIRTAGLYGLAKSSMKAGGNFVELMIGKAQRGEAIRVVNDQVTGPTYTKLLARDIAALIQTKNYGLYHIVSRSSCTWYEFAKEIFSQLKLKANLTPATTKEIAAPAPRPHYSVLSCAKLSSLGLYTMPDWKEGLREYLKDTKKI